MLWTRGKWKTGFSGPKHVGEVYVSLLFSRLIHLQESKNKVFVHSPSGLLAWGCHSGWLCVNVGGSSVAMVDEGGWKDKCEAAFQVSPSSSIWKGDCWELALSGLLHWWLRPDTQWESPADSLWTSAHWPGLIGGWILECGVRWRV